MRVTILGGGPSLIKTPNLEPPFIGVNMSMLHWPCDWGIWVDRSWWTRWNKDIPQGTQQWSIRPHYPPHVNQLNVQVSNSGGAAIYLAMELGFTEIYLAGFDMECTRGQPNWHKHYNRVTHPPKWYVDTWGADFERIAQVAEEKGVQIWNLNPNSKLDLFPYLHNN